MNTASTARRSRFFRLAGAGLCCVLGALPLETALSVQPERDEPWLHAPFSTDTRGILRAANAISVADGTDILILLDEHSLVYEADGRKTRTRRQIYRVVTQSGAENWADVEYTWEPWHQDRPQIRARVITRDGGIHTLDPKTLSEAEVGREQDKVYSDRRSLGGPLPAIASGSIVEEEAVIRDRAPFFDQGEVVRTAFGRSMPVRRTRLLVDAPSSLPLRYEIQRLAGLEPKRTEAKGRVRLLFEQGPAEPVPDPPDFLPGEDPRYPNVTLSTGASWQAVASRYSELVEAQLRAADTKAILGDAQSGLRPGEDPVVRLVARLHAQVRYTGVEFGEAALVPRTPAEVMQRKYGDCKDKSALLVAMLRAAGRQAHLALLMTAPSHDVDPGLPGMGRFDHVIVYLPGNPPLWIDATDEFGRPGILPAPAQGRHALIVTPDTRELVRTPESGSADNQAIETREFFLSDMGPARSIETTEVTGSIESFYRSSFAVQDAKERLESLSTYTRQTYVSDEPPKFELSDVHDFSGPFRIRLEVFQARRGFTDLVESAVAIPLASITARLPFELRRVPEQAPPGALAAAQIPRRTSDWLLDESSVSEWRYKVHPPAGFHVSSLPKGGTTRMGTAFLSQEFKEEADGTVAAIIRFDIGSRRMTASQAEELRKGVAALGEQEALVIKFAHRGFTLLEAGKTREALAAFRARAADDPVAAVHHVRLARGLLNAGLGDAAHDEARKATEADPRSPLAWKTHGWVLQHDSLGRRFGKGFDYEGAAAAYRRTVGLDAKDYEAQADLAILLEHNSRGERYGPGARLDDAVASYAAIREQIKNTGLADNLALDYLRLGRLKECEEWLKIMPATQNRKTLQLVAATLSESADEAIRLAAREIADEGARRTTLRNAAAELIEMREYSPAAALLASAARGADNAAQLLGQVELFSQVKRYEDLNLPEDDPKTVVRRFFALLLSPGVSKADLANVLGKQAAADLNDEDTEKQIAALAGALRNMFSGSGMPPSVARDVVVGNLEMTQEGDPATGFRIRLQLPAASLGVFVVREDGKYRLADMLGDSGFLGGVVLDLADRNDLDAARKLLDWAREELTLPGGDDPYAGSAFPRLWERGQAGGAEAVRLAAASLLATTRHPQRAVEILTAARQKSSPNAKRAAIELALATAYGRLEQYERLLDVASGLLKAAPKSDAMFQMTLLAHLRLQRWNEAGSVIAARLALVPDDPIALRAQAELAEAQGRFDLAVGHYRRVTSTTRAEAGDWNNLAWDALFLEALPADAVAQAQKAATQSQNRLPGILHTLAAVLAASGHAGEARSLMLQVMEMQGLEEPGPGIWLLAGMIAEEYGEREAAIAAYGRVKPQKGEEHMQNSSFQLARRRLLRLGVQ